MAASRCSLLGALALAVLVASCASGGAGSGAGGDGGSTGERVAVADDEALRWGDGAYGVVLAHGAAYDAASWEQQATAIADQGATVLAVESIEPDAIAAAARRLQSEGVADVALVGASAGADAILDLVSGQPDLPDQLVLLSPNGTVEGLGDQPKLFIASQDEPVADVSTELADSAPGSRNETLLLPGSAHAQAIFDGAQADAATGALLRRLREFA